MQILFTYTLFKNTLRKCYMNITSNKLDYCFLNDTLKCPSLTHDTSLSKLTFKKKFIWIRSSTLCAYSILKSWQKYKKKVDGCRMKKFSLCMKFLSLMAALAKLTQDAPRHQPPVLLGGLFIRLGAVVSWRERKGFPWAGRKTVTEGIISLNRNLIRSVYYYP